MRRTRSIYAIAVALVLGVSGVVMGSAAPAFAATNFALIYYPSLPDTPNLCLGVNSSKDAIIADCSFNGNQLWHLGSRYGSSGYYQVINNSDGKCLAVSGGSEDNGAQVIVYTCETGSAHKDQYWDVDISTTSHEGWVFDYKSGYVLQPTSISNGDLVKQRPWGGLNANDQLWVKAT